MKKITKARLCLGISILLVILGPSTIGMVLYHYYEMAYQPSIGQLVVLGTILFASLFGSWGYYQVYKDYKRLAKRVMGHTHMIWDPEKQSFELVEDRRWVEYD